MEGNCPKCPSKDDMGYGGGYSETEAPPEGFAPPQPQMSMPPMPPPPGSGLGMPPSMGLGQPPNVDMGINTAMGSAPPGSLPPELLRLLQGGGGF